jgi:hypothetical protein
MNRFSTLLPAVLIALLSFSSHVNAKFGLGVHYGMDFSLSMEEQIGDQIAFEGLTLNTDAGFENLPGQFPTEFDADQIPIFIDRSFVDDADNIKRYPLNIGGKVYVDLIPFLDCIELSANFGVWQYDGQIRYPVGISVNDSYDPNVESIIDMETDSMVEIDYDTMSLRLDAADEWFLGLNATPYAKLQFDLNIRKYLKIAIIDKVIKPYAGGGFNMHFATPALSTGLIEDAIGEKLSDPSGSQSIDDIVPVFADSANTKAIVTEIRNRMMTPHFGVNILAGVMVKIPIIPIGVYADGKFMIPFGPYDEDAQIKGYGFLLNAGIALHF